MTEGDGRVLVDREEMVERQRRKGRKGEFLMRDEKD